jgi:hypothetical protein
VIGTGSGLLLVALFVAGLAPACGGADGTPEGAPATPASAAVQTAPAGTTLTSLPVGPIPAGPYVTEAFEPPFSFALGQGWGSASEATGKLVINRGSINLERSVVFFTLAEVYRPDGSNAPVPDDLLAFLKAHPDLRVSEPEPVTVGGLTGVQVDFDAISASSWVRELGKCSTVPACVPLANGVVLQLQVRHHVAARLVRRRRRRPVRRLGRTVGHAAADRSPADRQVARGLGPAHARSRRSG